MLKHGAWCLLCLPFAAMAAPTPAAKAEIDGLIDALVQSGCRFERNGSWYDADRARAHLQRKYDYLLRKDLVDSAEQFIARAVSASSLSGQAYRVNCQGREQDAGPWFNTQLQRLRQRGASTP